MNATSLWTAVGALATAVGAGAAVWAAAVAVRTLRAVKADSIDRSRPVIVADLVIPPLQDTAADLVVSSVGNSAARNLQVSFTPSPLVIDDDREAKTAVYIEKHYKDAIPVLAAGARLSNVYALMGSDGRNMEPLPDRFSVHVEYDDMESRHHYSDSFELDVALLRGETFHRPGGDNYDRRIAKALEAVARGVGDL